MRISIQKIFFLFIVLCFINAACFPPYSFAKNNDIVFVTNKGKKYHYRDCKTLMKSPQVYKKTIQQAKTDGYKACKVCRPPQ